MRAATARPRKAIWSMLPARSCKSPISEVLCPASLYRAFSHNEIVGTSGAGWLVCPCASDQLHPLQARMAVSAYDDVVVHGDAERLRDIDDRFRHLDIGLRWRGIAGRVIVHQDDRGRR